LYIAAVRLASGAGTQSFTGGQAYERLDDLDPADI